MSARNGIPYFRPHHWSHLASLHVLASQEDTLLAWFHFLFAFFNALSGSGPCLVLCSELSSGAGSVVEGDIGGLSLRDPPSSVSKDVTCPPSSSSILSEAFGRLCIVPQMYLKKFQEVCYAKQAVERSK